MKMTNLKSEMSRATFTIGATLVAAVFMTLLSGNADAAKPESMRTSKSVRSAKPKPEGLRRKRNLVFDGRTSETLSPSKYDSMSQLADGSQNGLKRLYSLPRDFSNRVADQRIEMGYRQ